MKQSSVQLQQSNKNAPYLFSKEGSGRAYVAVCEERSPYRKLFDDLIDLESSTLYKIIIPEINDSNWQEVATGFEELHKAEKIRHANYIAFGDASTIVQHWALNNLKNLRSLVFVDATTRPHPSRFLQVIDKIEHALPLGLPLRLNTSGFDSKPFLQRIRCPVLIVTSTLASGYTIEQSATLKAQLPTAWGVKFDLNDGALELRKLLNQFAEVQAKVPQRAKN